MFGFLQVSKCIKHYISEALSRISATILLLTTSFALLEIIRRYIFGIVFEWGQDAVVYAMVAAVSIFFAVTQVRRGHLAMSAVVQLLNSRRLFKTVGLLKIAVSFVIFVFCGSLSWTAWPSITRSIMMERKTQSLVFDLWPFQTILMVGLGLMALVALLQTIEDTISFYKGEHLNGQVELTTDV